MLFELVDATLDRIAVRVDPASMDDGDALVPVRRRTLVRPDPPRRLRRVNPSARNRRNSSRRGSTRRASLVKIPA